MYDLFGDIHGYADELVELLEKLGYAETRDGFRHRERQAVFCGDFIDRGPRIPDVLRIVRQMVASGAAQAVIGNHEYNALAFHTCRPGVPGDYLRPHNEPNVAQHQATLDQLNDADLASALAWFRTLPAALDLGCARVVHACWDPECIQLIAESLQHHGGFTPSFLDVSVNPEQNLHTAVERVLKGPELKLPQGTFVRDQEGCLRRRIRIRWFESPRNHSFASYAMPTADHPELAARPVEGSFRAVPYDSELPPVFFGHYWMNDAAPKPVARNIACLDYSIAKNGFLCAYRFRGEAQLSAAGFATVPGRARQAARGVNP